MDISNIIVELIFYVISLGLLIYYQKSHDKKHFLISVLMIGVASIITFLNNYENRVMVFFPLAIFTSLIGDLFMAEKIKLFESRIISGILVFAIAHIMYIYAFYNLGKGDFEVWQIGLGIILWMLVFFVGVYSSETKQVLSVASFIYAGILTVFFVVVLRFIMTDSTDTIIAVFAFVGIILFMTSDMVIARNEFKKEVKHAEVIISITYIVSQILLQGSAIVISLNQ